jgi:hypothetical protein
MNALSKIIIFILISTFLICCNKSDNFSDIPYLEFTRYQLKDSVDALGNIKKICELHIYFTDGDGDIGLFEDDTIPPYDYNLFVNYFEMQQDTFLKVDISPPYHIRIPDLMPSGQNKTLKAELKYDIDITYRNSNVIRFELKLFDRSLNESNWIITPSINVN